MEIRQLTPEESAALDAKYGKPLGPVGSIKRDPRYPVHSNIKVIVKEVKEVNKGGRPRINIGACKECEEPSFCKGYCKFHYYKQWRWNH